MFGVPNFKYEDAKREISVMVYGSANLAAGAKEIPPPRYEFPTPQKTFAAFSGWLHATQDLQNHKFNVPSLNVKESTEPWSLAWLAVHAEIFLKIGDIVEKTVAHRRQHAGKDYSKGQSAYDDAKLSQIREARAALAEFFTEFESDIRKETRTDAFDKDHGVVLLAISTENLPIKFALLEELLNKRITANAPEATDPPPRNHEYHNWANSLGLRPMGLYPSLGQSAAQAPR